MYIIVITIATICLFAYNDFQVPEFGNKTVISAKNLTGFKNGSLLIIDKNIDKIEEGNSILYYDTYTTNNIITIHKIKSKEKTNEMETTFILENDNLLSSKYVIGSTKQIVSIPFVGYFFSFITSSLGYLVCIIVPLLMLLIYEVFMLRKEYQK